MVNGALQRTLAVSILFLLVFLAVTPLVYAQSDAELRATIRAAILSDPRTADMTEEEVEAMVSALAEEASAQGVTAYDIAWRPTPEGEAVAARCGAMPVFFCTLNEAFGFDGSDLTIPIGLGVTAAILLFVIGSLLLHRHGHHPLAGAVGAPGNRSS